MGKASSAKKVARAARAGGRRSGTAAAARASRSPSAPSSSSACCWSPSPARATRSAPTPTNRPKRGDHWHAAYGVYICDQFVTDVADKGQDDPLGIHTHDDGAHPHPPVQHAGRGRAGHARQVLRPGRRRGHRPTIKLPSADRSTAACTRRARRPAAASRPRSRSSTGRTRSTTADGAKPAKIFTEDFGEHPLHRGPRRLHDRLRARGRRTSRAPPSAAQHRPERPSDVDGAGTGGDRPRAPRARPTPSRRDDRARLGATAPAHAHRRRPPPPTPAG